MNPHDSVIVARRPVWRSFKPKFVDRAGLHVKAGGFAAILYPNGEIKAYLPRAKDGQLREMSLWALLSLEVRRWGSPRSGPLRGAASIRVRKEHRDIIREWCERDSAEPKSTRVMKLDCLACGACCRDNRVVLEEPDLARWRREGRADLLGKAYLRRSNGTVLLKLHQGACVHLGGGNLCTIYPVRPDNCSSFPVASEPCLSARLETLGVSD